MRYSLLLVIAGAVIGCGGAAMKKSGAPAPVAEQEKPAVLLSQSPPDDRSQFGASGLTDGRRSAKVPNADAIRRKIVYKATVDLVVENFEPVPARVDALVKQFDAYLARSNVNGQPGSPRSARWTVRVPAERYDAFLAAARQLGEVRNVTCDSQDVTEEFYDVEARIRNKKQEETRLLKLLETATGKLEEVLAVEREISRVRGEVEQAEGRMRVLADLTTLATVEVVVTEIKNYVPEEAATYMTRVRRSFQNSIEALVLTAQGLSIMAIALSPWLAVLLVPGLPLALWLRARRRRRRSGQ